jgi:rubrerythrin
MDKITKPVYEDLLEAYEKDGAVPICAHHYDLNLRQPIYTCPWCGLDFWVGLTSQKTLHCPDCCMEINLF